MSEYFQRYIKKDHFQKYPNQIKFKSTFENCVNKTMAKRGYKKTEENDWDIFWCEKHQVAGILDTMRLQPTRRVNHYRNFYQICRKDLLSKNIKKHRKALQREGKKEEANCFNFAPMTYNLPSQYPIFMEEFKRAKEQKPIWIMKPIGSSQGKGIFLFKGLGQIQQWSQMANQAEPYIVQRYIHNPLTVGHKKFDFRIYVLVTSYNPLTAYIYRQGFARFTHTRYEQNNLDSKQGHLPNVAIQKLSKFYDEEKGGKYSITKIKHYLMSKYGEAQVQSCFFNIQEVIVRTLEATSKVMINDKRCFNIYGFDILIDKNLKPWLIQVNGSPSFTHNTKVDEELKTGLLDDTLSILDMQGILNGTQEQIGGFDLIYKSKRVLPHGKNVTGLGTLNDRMKQMRKMAKVTALRLADKTKKQEQGKRGKSTVIPPKNSYGGNISNTRIADQKAKLPKMGTMGAPVNKSFNINTVKKPVTQTQKNLRNTNSREAKV